MQQQAEPEMHDSSDADITMIDFVSQTRGWAIDSAQVLYQTTDGGQTWTKV